MKKILCLILFLLAAFAATPAKAQSGTTGTVQLALNDVYCGGLCSIQNYVTSWLSITSRQSCILQNGHRICRTITDYTLNLENTEEGYLTSRAPGGSYLEYALMSNIDGQEARIAQTWTANYVYLNDPIQWEANMETGNTAPDTTTWDDTVTFNYYGMVFADYISYYIEAAYEMSYILQGSAFDCGPDARCYYSTTPWCNGMNMAAQPPDLYASPVGETAIGTPNYEDNFALCGSWNGLQPFTCSPFIAFPRWGSQPKSNTCSCHSNSSTWKCYQGSPPIQIF